jgi:hypothetical protein
MIVVPHVSRFTRSVPAPVIHATRVAAGFAHSAPP